MTGLAAVDDTAVEALRGIKFGTLVQVEVIRVRNAKHHRLYWAMCAKIANAVGLTPENVSDVLKLHTGHYTTIVTDRGTYKVPKSISFAAMDQVAFREFFDRCCEVICIEWLPHMTKAQVRTEVLQMMGIDWKEPSDEEQGRQAPQATADDLRADAT